MRPFAFLLAVGYLLLTSLPADAQWFGQRLSSCADGSCESSVAAPQWSIPTYVPSPMRVTSPSYATTSTPQTVSYGVGDEGQVLAPNGDTVRSVGGVEVVSKAWAEKRIRTAEEAAMSYASIPAGCDCKDYSAELAEIKTTLERIEQRLPYGDKQSTNRQKIEQQLAEQAAVRAIVQARIEGSLALK